MTKRVAGRFGDVVDMGDTTTAAAVSEARRTRDASDYRGLVEGLRDVSGPMAAAVASATYGPALPQEAVRRIREATNVSDALYVLGAELWSHHDTQLEAVEVLRVAASSGSDDAVAILGDVLGWFGMHEEAVTYLKDARHRDLGDSAWIAGLLGLSLLALGEEKSVAEELLGEGAAVYTEFGVEYATVLRARGAIEEAVVVLTGLVGVGVYGAALHLGNILSDDLGDRDGAIAAYLTGIASGDAHSAFNLAVLYYDEESEAEAEYYKMVARAMGDLSPWPDGT